MANDSQFIGSGGTVAVSPTGALGGDGSVSNPLAVQVDGVTVVIVGDALTAPSGGGGTIGGTVGATDNRIVRSDGTGGSTIQGSAVSIGDTGVVTGASIAGSQLTGAYTSAALTMNTAKMLGRATASSGAVEEIAVTGTGSAVLATSPTLVTPLLGTPTSGVLTNCTGLPEAGLTLANNVTANVSTARHGFAPILPNDATKYLDGTGGYTVPSSGGYIKPAYVAKTGNYTLDFATDGTVELTSNAGTFTFPTAVGHAGYGFIIKNAQTANALTIATTGGQTIEGATSLTNGALGAISDGSNWRLVSDLGLGLTTLTSGGVIFADSNATIASSGLLLSNALVLGGGAGAAPKTATGVASDGTSQVQLGQSGTSAGSVLFNNQTSGTITVAPPTSGGLGTRTMTLPLATDTFVGKATSDVFTNKTLDTAGTGNVFKINTEQVTSIGAGLDITAGVLDVSGAGGLTSAFTSAIVSGQTTVTAVGSQALTLVEGSNVSITTDNTAKSITINSTGGGGGTFPTILVNKNGTNQTSVPNNTDTLITWSNEVIDSNNNFASNKFTPTAAGYYLNTIQIYITDDTLNAFQEVALRKNGTEIFVTTLRSNSTGSQIIVTGTYLVSMNGSTDYLEAYVYGNGTGGVNTTFTLSGGVEQTFWHATRVGA